LSNEDEDVAEVAELMAFGTILADMLTHPEAITGAMREMNQNASAVIKAAMADRTPAPPPPTRWERIRRRLRRWI
jgi:spore germination cell wall hydrolase CwlJ-like protein